MNRKKVLLSIILLAALVAVGIALPSYWKAKKNLPTHQLAKTAQISEETKPKPTEASLSYEGFDALTSFFAEANIKDIKDMFADYFKGTDRTAITITFLPDKTDYPDNDRILFHFRLSDNTDFPVSYSTSTGAFFFGTEARKMDTALLVYKRQVDDDLPQYTPGEISEAEEGGYPDTKDDTIPEENEEVQP